MKLQFKIVSGFVILALMLFTAGVFSIIELKSIGTTASQMLDENYASIRATEAMIEALEREDSGILLLLLGRWDEGRQILASADSQFSVQLQTAENNLTIGQEEVFLDTIKARYSQFKEIWLKPIVDTKKQGNLEWYFGSLYEKLVAVKHSVQKLSALNESHMYQTAAELKNKANRAIMPGIIAIVTSIVFIFIFNFFIHLYVIAPLRKMTRAVASLKANQKLRVEVETKDEIYELIEEIKSLLNKHLKF